MPNKIHFRQSDVRRGATLLAKYKKAVRLEREATVVRDVYVQWIEFRNQFVHEHSLEEETDLYLVQHPEISKGLTV